MMSAIRQHTPDKWRWIIIVIAGVSLCLAGLAIGPAYLSAQAPIPTLTPTIFYVTAVYPPRPHTPTATLIPDNQPPVMTVFITGQQVSPGWYRVPISLTFFTMDDLSGPGRSWYKFEHEANWRYTENGFPPAVITRTGVYTLYYLAQDRNYNIINPPLSRTLVLVEAEVSRVYLPLILKVPFLR